MPFLLLSHWQSKERARQLRADLAVEEHRGLELSRILKEGLSETKTPSTKKSRPGRKVSGYNFEIIFSVIFNTLPYRGSNCAYARGLDQSLVEKDFPDLYLNIFNQISFAIFIGFFSQEIHSFFFF